jgi:LPXTG-site transpeptidase (sortase) family protein
VKGKGSALRSWIGGRGPRLTRLALVALPVASAAVGVALVVLVAGTFFGGSEPAARPRPTESAAKPTATPIPSDAPVDRMIVSKIGLDAPIEVLPVEDGVMRGSSGPEVVSLYDFSPYSAEFGGRPGFGGNAVFGGHVDYINYGPAVFWDLDELKEGDQVEVRLTDGTVYRYAVTWNKTFPWSDMPWDYVLKPEKGIESVTLMTCSGSWTGSQYTDARVVRADRIPGGASVTAGGP